MRRKLLEKDGLKMWVSPLTIEQVEDHLKELNVILEDETADRSLKLRGLWQRFVLRGLNNAQNGDGEQPWTEDRITKELDLLLFAELRAQIITLSGLQVEPTAAPGEAPATS
jgi:hypothetical protein